MSDPTSPRDHAFIRPGQIIPEHPAADACMVCGRSEAAHDHAPTEANGFADYNRLVAAEAERLTATIAAIRADQEAGFLTVCEAADNTIAVLEEHLRRLGELRERYLGD